MRTVCPLFFCEFSASVVLFLLRHEHSNRARYACIAYVHTSVSAGNTSYKLSSIELQFFVDGHHKYELKRICQWLHRTFPINEQRFSKLMRCEHQWKEERTAKNRVNFQIEGNFNDSFIESIRWKENKWKIDEQFSNSAVPIEAVSISSYAAELRTR